MTDVDKIEDATVYSAYCDLCEWSGPVTVNEEVAVEQGKSHEEHCPNRIIEPTS